MKDLIVIGAGGYGREVIQWAADCNRQAARWNILGFLDPNPDALCGSNCPYPVLGTDQDWVPTEDQEFAVAVADPTKKERIVSDFSARGARFATIVHPTAFIAEGASIGYGTVVYPQACISIDAKVGRFCTIQTTGLGHDVTVGDYSTISSFCNLMGHVTLGKRVFLGSHCAVVPGTAIEDDAYVGVGSVVLRRVRAGTKVYGNPARKIDL